MIHARFDSSLSATIVARRALAYTAGADPAVDRPTHVRAGSAVARVGKRLVVIQDDTSFLAIVDEHEVHALPFPAGPAGRRQFDERLGNKQHKLDLESCVLRGDTLVGFGSGSTSARERVVIVDGVSTPSPTVRVIEAPAFYRALRQETSFAGGELNMEGAALRGDTLVLFQRGNGAARDGLVPVNATCEIAFEELWRHLVGGAPSPSPRAIAQYDLGAIDRVPLTFTDATATASGALIFLAAAEDSPDAYNDGPVTGVALGIIEGTSVRLVPILETNGAPMRAKAEGIALRADDPSHADVVTDRDDPDAPCELYTIELRGFL